MQKQTFKLPKHLALGFAALMLVLTPETHANAVVGGWNFLAQGNLSYTFRPRKMKLKANDKGMPTALQSAVDIFTTKDKDSKDGEIELDTEHVNFGHGLGFGVGLSAVYQVNEMFGIGPMVELGMSFHKEQWKSCKSLTLSEGFFGKIGIAMTITDWFMISAGLRASYLTADLTWSKEDKEEAGKKPATATAPKSFVDLWKTRKGTEEDLTESVNKADKTAADAISAAKDAETAAKDAAEELAKNDTDANKKAAVEAAAKAAETAETAETAAKDACSAQDKLRDFMLSGSTAAAPLGDFKNISSSTWAWSLFLDAKVLIPITENLKAIITVGVYGDMFAPEFTSWSGEDNKDLGVKLHDRMGIQASVGLGYQF